MTLASNNEFPSLLVKEGTAPASPSAGDQRLFIDSSDHLLKYKNSSGTVTTVGGGMSNPLTTTGDIIYSSSGTTAARRAIGSTGNVLTVAGGVPTWAAPASGLPVVAVADVATSEVSSSDSFGNLTTTGPAVTVTVPSSGNLRVICTATMSAGATAGGAMDFDLSGANTRSATLNTACTSQDIPGVLGLRGVAITVLTGLTPGSTTVTAKYRRVNANCTFSNREISAEILG